MARPGDIVIIYESAHSLNYATIFSPHQLFKGWFVAKATKIIAELLYNLPLTNFL